MEEGEVPAATLVKKDTSTEVSPRKTAEEPVPDSKRKGRLKLVNDKGERLKIKSVKKSK